VFGVSGVFGVVYVHVLRSVSCGLSVDGSFVVFVSGFSVFVVLVVVGFMGYVLPCSQMSF
jgi:ubiquinol-cytochrome c reductase cytochrome b subunit